MAGMITASLWLGSLTSGLPGSSGRLSRGSENGYTSEKGADVEDVQIDEFQRLRRLVPERPDHHLNQWGRWRRSYFGTNGYRSCSPGLVSGGISGEDAFEHMCDDVDHRAAEISDTIIGDMSLNHRIAIQHVYEAAVWKFRRLSIEDLIIEAATDFWNRAIRKGLV